MAAPKDRVTRPGGFEPPDETTEQNEPSRELLDSLREQSDRITTRQGERPPMRPPMPSDPKQDDATVRRKILVGPDGVPRVLDDDELDEPTRRMPAKKAPEPT
jgi:hypothetical protein